MMKYMERFLFGCAVLLLPISGFACSFDQWVPGETGDVTVGTPNDITIDFPDGIPRVSELCGMQADATANNSYVQDNSPDNHTTFIVRFYVRPAFTGSGPTDLFVAYDSSDQQLIKVSYDGANLDFHSDSSTVLGTASASPSFWHLVEIEYTSAGNTRFWVDSNASTVPDPDTMAPLPDAPTGTYASATGGVDYVRLGLPGGQGGFTGGFAGYDSYESHSSTPVGPVKVGDANGDGNWNVLDYGAVQNDAAGNLVAGQPDCNLDGFTNILDYGCVQLKIANAP